MFWDCLAGEVTRSDDDVRAVERADDRRRERRIMLTVGINGQHRGRSLLQRESESGAQGRALPLVLIEFDRLIRNSAKEFSRAVS